MGPHGTESLSELMARQAMEALRHHWDGAYTFRRQGGEWVAERADGLGVVRAGSAELLADLVQADYSARPVPREPLG